MTSYDMSAPLRCAVLLSDRHNEAPVSQASIAVVIPALNEQESLLGVLQTLPASAHVIVVDNGSTDNTARIAIDAGAQLVTENRRGYGSAVLCGIQALKRNPPDVVVILDADGADPPELLSLLVQPIVDGNADMVLSNRTRTAEPGALNFTQRAGNRFACQLIHLVTRHSFEDMGPFRAIRWQSLMLLQMEDPTWGWNVEMQIKAVRRGLRILEVPTPYRCRSGGKSKISGSLRGTLRAGAKILWAVGKYRKG